MLGKRMAQSTASAATSLLPVYLGDDIADEDAFRAVVRLGGIGVKVADGMVPSDTTAATWSLRQPEVVEFLRGFMNTPTAATMA